MIDHNDLANEEFNKAWDIFMKELIKNPEAFDEFEEPDLAVPSYPGQAPKLCFERPPYEFMRDPKKEARKVVKWCEGFAIRQGIVPESPRGRAVRWIKERGKGPSKRRRIIVKSHSLPGIRRKFEPVDPAAMEREIEPARARLLAYGKKVKIILDSGESLDDNASSSTRTEETRS